MSIALRTIAVILAPALTLGTPGAAHGVTVTRADDLSFGTVLAGSGGTVTVPAAPGAPQSTGGVLLEGPQFPQGGAASFDVLNDGTSSQDYSLNLSSTPANLGAAGLALSNYTVSPGSISLGPGQSVRIYVGATLTLTGAVPNPGPHTATVPLTLLAQ